MADFLLVGLCVLFFSLAEPSQWGFDQGIEEAKSSAAALLLSSGSSIIVL